MMIDAPTVLWVAVKKFTLKYHKRDILFNIVNNLVSETSILHRSPV